MPTDLPSDFLSTPFGAALRPTIDNMFRRPVPGAAPTPATMQPSPAAAQAAVNASPNPALAASLLQAVANQAFSPSTSTPNGAGPSLSVPVPAQPQTSSSANTVSAPVHICTNPSSFHSLLSAHRAVVAMFTSATCGPCRMIEPVFEDLAWAKTHGLGKDRVAFVKIDMGVGMGGQVAAECGIRVTPTFLFFLDGQKVGGRLAVSVLSAAHIHHVISRTSSRAQTRASYAARWTCCSSKRSLVCYFLLHGYHNNSCCTLIAHPHTKLSLPAIEALSTNPILFTQVPALDSVLAKLASFVDTSSPSPAVTAAKTKLSQSFPVYLKARFPADKGAQPPKNLSANPQLVASWAEATRTLADALPTAQLFPLVDLWRLAILDGPIATWCATAPTESSPVHGFLRKAAEALHAGDTAARNTVLVTLRLLANATAHGALARGLLSAGGGERAETTRVLVASLLHADAQVRTAGASLAFNTAAYVQRGRVGKVRGDASAGSAREEEEDGEWEVELVSAVLEAVAKETQSEEVGECARLVDVVCVRVLIPLVSAVHRLTAALAFLLRLSPVYESQLVPFLEVLQARETLKGKLQKGGCGENGVQKPEVRKLVLEVAEKLCP